MARREIISGGHAICATRSQPTEPIPPSAFLYQPERDRCVCRRAKSCPGIDNARQARMITTSSKPGLRIANCTRKPSVVRTTKARSFGGAARRKPVVMAFRKKMASEEAQQRYRRRGRIVEFCHAWIKSKLGCGIPCAWPGKGADGNAVACSHTPAALDPPKQTPRNTSSHLRE